MTHVLGAQLPSGWPTSKLKLVTSFLNRGTAPNYVDYGPVRVIGQAANQADGIDWSRTRFHDHSGDPTTLKGHLHPGDVLINSTGTGTLGRVGYFSGPPDALPCMADGHVSVVRFAGSEVYSRFAYYWLSSQPFREYVYAALVVGATNQIELNRERLADSPIPLPPLEEQQRIADFLDAETARIDRLCELSRQQAAVLLERLVVDMRGIVTGATNEPAPTGIPWMPYISAEWRLGKIAHLFRTGSGTTPSAGNSAYFDGDLPWINSADIHGGIVTDSSRHITWQAVRDFPSLRKHPKGSLVLAMYGQGETKGRVAILGIDAYVNQACCVMSPLGNLSAEFAYFWFRAFKEGVVSLAFGAGQPNLSQDLIRGIRVPVPDPPSQVSIVHRLRELERHVTNQREALNRRTELLQERRQALITAAVTGQLGVATARGADLS